MTKYIKVEKKQVAELAKLASEIWFEYWKNILSLGQISHMLKKFQSEKAINDQIIFDHYHYFFINDDEQNIGYFGISTKHYCLFLSKLYIKKEYRNKGIGSSAFEKVKQFALDNNFKKIRLTVNKFNMPAIKAYEKWGFVTVGTEETPIGDGYIMDDYIMEYKF